MDCIRNMQKGIYYCKIQVKFDTGNHPQNFLALFQLSFCCCIDIGFVSITFALMHGFHWKFAERYIHVSL